MAPLIFDRAQETTTSTGGTGDLTLNGAVSTFQTLACVGNAGLFTYEIRHQTANEWETGIGEYSTTGPAIIRRRVLESSNGNNLVDFSTGVKFVGIAPLAKIHHVLLTPGKQCFRLTFSSGNPYPTTDLTDQATLYCTPVKPHGKKLWLWEGYYWKPFTLPEFSMPLTATTAQALTGDTTNASAVVTNVTTTNLYVGMPISGTGIPASTVIKTIDSGTQITMTNAATATNTGVNLAFYHANMDVFAFTTDATPLSTDTSTDVLTFAGSHPWKMGSVVTAAVTGGGLTAGTQYFYRAVSSTTGSLHTTLAGAIADTGKVNLTASITAILTAVSMEGFGGWSSSILRNPELADKDGVYVKSGDDTRLYLGSYRLTDASAAGAGAGKSCDTLNKRFLYNEYHKKERKLKKTEAANNWTYGTNTWRPFNGGGAAGGLDNRVEVLLGQAGMMIHLTAHAQCSATSGVIGIIGIDEDGITTNDSEHGGVLSNTDATSTITLPAIKEMLAQPGLGYHFWQMMEIATQGTPTFYSTSGVLRASGILGWFMN